MIASGECIGCGRCIAICPESSLRFALRARLRPARPPALNANPPSGGTP
jgi:ferredoxin